MGAFIERQNEILIGKKERIIKIPKLEQIWVYLRKSKAPGIMVYAIIPST